VRYLLGQPEMCALLAATPKAWRVLAQLSLMLGIEESLPHPVCPAPPVPAPMPEIVTSNADAAPVDSDGKPPPPEDVDHRAPDPPPEPGVEFFVPT
jgi:hypothetical protein